MSGQRYATCPVCFRHCRLQPGEFGFCNGRIGTENSVIGARYGKLSGISLDPIEKKPLYHFHPGTQILSVGSYGCNMRCEYCQNHEISQEKIPEKCLEMPPKKLVSQAVALRENGNIGIAFTYNEPSINYEYVIEASSQAKRQNLKIALVTNGCYDKIVREQFLPVIDAYNIDIKCFSQQGYQWLGGHFESVLQSVEAAASQAHLEVTTLVVPGFSDSPQEIREMARWLASVSPDIVLHLSRYFPRWKSQAPPTGLDTLRQLQETAQEYLPYVYLGNC